MNFVAATKVDVIGTKRNEHTRMKLVEAAFSAMTRILAAHAGQESPLFPCEVDEVSPLVPLAFVMRLGV